MKHIKTFEGRNTYHFFYNFNISDNIREIFNILDTLEDKVKDYKIFQVDNDNFMFYFITNNDYLTNYYPRRFNYEISDDGLPDYKTINKSDLEMILKSNKFNI